MVADILDGNLVYKAAVDLGSGAARKRFALRCTEANERIEFRVVNYDLTKLSLMVMDTYLEFLGLSDTGSKAEYKMSAAETIEGEKLLADPNLINRVYDMIVNLGIVGEEFNSLTLYTCFTSRLLERPINCMILGLSSSGKSYIVSKILQGLFPSECYQLVTDITPQALYYMHEDALVHKILVIAERPGIDRADYPFRIMQSEGELLILMPKKMITPLGTDMITGFKTVRGPFMSVTTTTKPIINFENDTRVLRLSTDDSQPQTRAVMNRLSQESSGKAMRPSDEELLVFKNAQRLLKPYHIVIPFARKTGPHFPDDVLRMRRDYRKFLTMVATFALLHQRQRRIEEQGEGQLPLLFAEHMDYELARAFFTPIIESSVSGVSGKSMEIYRWMEERRWEGKKNIDGQRKAHTFTYQEIALGIGAPLNTVRDWLVDLERIGALEFTDDNFRGGRDHHRQFVLTDVRPITINLPEQLEGETKSNWQPPEGYKNWRYPTKTTKQKREN